MNGKSLILIPLFVILSAGVFAQTDYLAEGDKYYKEKDYKNALSNYLRAIRTNRNNASLLYKIGCVYLTTETKEIALSYFKNAYKLDPNVDPEILLNMGIAYQSCYKYAAAKQMYEGYKKRIPKKQWPEIDKRIDECMFSFALINNPIDVIIENAGSSINSAFNDYCPIVSTNGETLIFTSNRPTDSIQLKLGKNFEDIYISTWDEDEWGAPKKIGKSINVSSHDAASFLSYDGKTLFIYYGTNNGDLYTSTLDAKGEWSKPVPLNSNINTAKFRETAASMSADGKRLFFASDRPGGKGNLDLYMSQKGEDGQWGKPINLGPEINTPGDEDSPYIHPDGVTLYFSSDGHPGMGSSDIFKSELKNGNWQKPQNLGYPINSIQYDGFFTISPDKSTAYFTSKRKYGVGEYDILKATYRNVYYEMPPVPTEAPLAKKEPEKKVEPEKKNEPVKKEAVAANTPQAITLYGKAFDKKTNAPLDVTVSVVDFRTQRQVALVKASGDYTLNVYKGGKYTITAEATGYLYNSENITVADTGTPKLKTDFGMTKVDAGSVMVLKNLFFDSGKADLKPGSITELEKVRSMLLANPQLRVQINGHTDNMGDPELNKTLSLKRALAVVNHLALNGIEFDRLSAKGYGDEQPIATNDREKGGREMNRRTEIEILKSDDVAYSN